MDTDALKSVVQILSAALVPVVAIVGTFIAWRQAHLNNLKMRFDLYARRIEVYDNIQNALVELTVTGSVPDKAFSLAHRARRDSEFLFGDEVHAAIQATVEKFYNLRSVLSKTKRLHAHGNPTGNSEHDEKLTALYREADTIWDLLNDEKEILHKLMLPYMKFPK